jgi:hypothetical protein
MKKFFLLIILTSLFSFSACWIQPLSEDYTLIDDTYYFSDYESMRAFTVPKINETFTDWHYGKTKFDSRYKSYLGNIEANEENYAVIQENNYSYAVKTGTSNSTISIKENERTTTIKGKYFWITNKNGVGTIFFKN